MISRRTFLFCSSLTPLLVFLGKPFNFVAANTEYLNARFNQLESEKSAGLVIEGWHEQDSDLSKTQLISLSSAWKSSWL